MKVLTLFIITLFGRARAAKPHNDNLRAGQWQDEPFFSPWKALVS